jgi:hypothetical protein
MAKKSKKQTSSAPVGFPEKSWSKLSEAWREGAQTKEVEDLEKDIINAVRAMADSSIDMKNDSTLQGLIEEVKSKKSLYTETIAEQKAIVDFCVYQLNTRGGKVSKKVKDAIKKAGEVDDEEASD